MQKPTPPPGFISFKWKHAKVGDNSVVLCPGCGKFEGYVSGGKNHGGWQDKTAMALYRHSERKGLGFSKGSWSNMLVMIDRDYLRNHWSRYGTEKCIGCQIEIFHDFLCDHQKGCTCGDWHYYYKPKGQTILSEVRT